MRQNEPGDTSVAKKVMIGAIWLTLLQWISRSIGILSTLIIARILAPESYGIIALLTIAIGLVENLLEFGGNSYLVNKKETDRADYNTAWTINIIIYSILGLSTYLLSKQLADFLNEPRLDYTLQIFAVFFALTGFRNIGIVQLNKELKFNLLFLHGFTQKILSFAVTVYFAYELQNYWALVFGMITTRVTDVVFSYVFSRYRPRLQLSKFHEQWEFSKWIISGNIIGYLRAKSDAIIIGKFLGAETIGLSTMAADLASMPAVELIYPVLSPIYAGYAKLLHDPERLTNAFVTVNGLVATLVFPMLGGLWYLSAPLVALALGGKWLAAAPILQLTIYSITLQVFSEIFRSFLQVNNKVKWVAICNAFLSIFGIGLLLYVTVIMKAGLDGVLIGRALVYFVSLALFYFGIRPIDNLKFLRIFRVWLRPFFASLIMVLALQHIHVAQYIEQPILALVANVLLGAAIYGSISTVVWYLAKRPEGGEAFVLQNVWHILRHKAG